MNRLGRWFCLIALALPGADLSGRWSGTMEKIKGGAAGGPVEQYQLTLKQDGGTITGTVGPGKANWEIQNAKLKGSTLTFETSIAGGKFLVAYELHLRGSDLTGTMTGRKGPPVQGKLRFTRQ